MSLYNALFGQNADAPKFLAILNHVAPFDPPRFRDCYFDGEFIVVHTRTGGGNRECWCDEGSEHACFGAANDAMTTHPWYVRDVDDDFDSTYADWFFRPTPEIAATLTKTDGTPAERWQELFAKMQAGEMPPEAQKVADAIMPALTDMLDNGKSGVINI